MEEPGVALAIRGSVKHHQLIPPTIADGTPYHDQGSMVTIHILDECVYQFLPLLAAQTSTTMTVKLCDARLIREDKSASGA